MVRCVFMALVAWVLLPAAVARADAMSVVATFSILGDLVNAVGGDRVSVQTLVGANGDSHAYSPKPTDAKRLAAAKLIFVNGLDFERWLDRLVESANVRARIVTASKGVMTRRTPSGETDPHAWQSAANTLVYVTNIRDALIAADPASRDVFERNAAAYGTKLRALDDEIRQSLARLPAEKRRAVTAHPSFQYFGAAYGLQFISPQVQTHEAETSAKTLAALVDTIRRDRVAAIFVESTGDPRLMQQVAAETGVRLGGALYADALTDSSGPAPDYLGLMQHNARTIAAALGD